VKRRTGAKPDNLAAPPDRRSGPALARMVRRSRCLRRFSPWLHLRRAPQVTRQAAAESTGCGSDTAAFARARSWRRYVLLYLEAVWCHCCHVMDEKTWCDTAIRSETDAH